MKTNFKLITILFIGVFIAFTSCSSDDEDSTDTQKPTISINYAGGFPQACEELQRGQTYIFKAQTTDNVGLASYSIDIHNNFDHHTHDNQEAECELEAVKDPVDPFLYLENFTIDGNPKSFEISQSITIPNNVDTGDYHCQFSVTDETGWQTQTSIDIKIIE